MEVERASGLGTRNGSDAAEYASGWGDQGGETEPPAELLYASMVEFLTEYLAPTYRRPLSANTSTWCAEWWRHPEAVQRIDALWRSWEHLRTDPSTGLSVWFRDHADHHMPVLLSESGPFKGCTPDAHAQRPLKPLPLTAPPDGLFPPVR